MGKIEEGYSLEQHVEGQSRRLDSPMLHLDLSQELEELRQGAPFRINGHNAKTLMKHPDLRVVLMAFKPGASLSQHHTVGRLTLHMLEGRVRVSLESERIELSKGMLFALGPSISHDLEAVEPSAVLLTIAWPAAGGAIHP
jgi:quercetin dioxygenase-like cupin family protein